MNGTDDQSYSQNEDLGQRPEAISHMSGDYSHMSGDYCHMSGDYSHTSGDYSHMSGDYGHTSGDYSHMSGDYSGDYSHTSGDYSHMSGDYSHTSGDYSHTSGDYSHMSGDYLRERGPPSEAQVQSRQQQRRIQQLESSASSSRYYRPSTLPRQSSSSSSSTLFSYHPSSSKASASPPTSTFTLSCSSAISGFGRIQQLESSASGSRYYRPSTPPRQSSSSSSSTLFSYPSSSKASTSPPTSTSTFASSSAGSGYDHTLGRHGNPPTPPVDREDSLMSALRLQCEYDDEDRALSVQRTQLAKSAQRLFECGICMDEKPVDSIARIDSCGHTFCRECLCGHVSARIDEHRFPVLCPTCSANNSKGKGKAGGTCRSVRVTPSSRDFPQRFHGH